MSNDHSLLNCSTPTIIFFIRLTCHCEDPLLAVLLFFFVLSIFFFGSINSPRKMCTDFMKLTNNLRQNIHKFFSQVQYEICTGETGQLKHRLKFPFKQNDKFSGAFRNTDSTYKDDLDSFFIWWRMVLKCGRKKVAHFFIMPPNASWIQNKSCTKTPPTSFIIFLCSHSHLKEFMFSYTSCSILSHALRCSPLP